MADIGPWPFDILTRVIKIVKGGEVFVAGAYSTDSVTDIDMVRHAKILRDDMAGGWQQVAEATDSYPFSFLFSGAYGLASVNPALPPVPTFVLCGQATDPYREFPPPQAQGFITTSTTGNAWTQSYRDLNNVYLMAWDETKKRFYAQAQNFDANSIDVLESIDGVAWNTVAIMPLSGSAASPLLEATGTPLIVDGNGKAVPYGSTFGWDRDNIWIAPRTIADAYSTSGPTSDPGPGEVEIIRRVINPDGSQTISRKFKKVPMNYCLCVAYGGGVWQAAGYDLEPDAPFRENTAVIAMSADTGETWQKVYTHAAELICCMMGGQPAPNP